MANWDSYTQKTTPADADTLMIKDTAGGANKRTPFSGVWNWIVGKLTSAVISQLETTNKSIVPAINELNSKIISGRLYNSLDDIPVQSLGLYILSDDICPDADASSYTGFCFGSNTIKTIFLVRPYSKTIFINGYTSGRWTGWSKFTGIAM